MNKPVKIDGTNGIMSDASIVYIDLVRSSAQHADPEAVVNMNKKYDRLDVTIVPSNPNHKEEIIKNILGFHKEMHLIFHFSKSLAKQKNIFYSLYFKED